MTAAGAEFRLDKPDDTGKTPRQTDHQNDFAIPVQFAQVWDWFLELRAWLAIDGTLRPLSNLEIISWARLAGRRLSRHHQELLFQLEALFWRVRNEPAEQKPVKRESFTKQFQKLKEYYEPKPVRTVAVNSPRKPK